ncbi:MAG: adenylate/guanylate cyclase domain-containing protein, partial [Ignavibacteria bacterium]
VIAGEIGDIKKDIVLHGDTMNTTARIQAECNKYGKKLLSSGELLKMITYAPVYKTEALGSIILRGKEKELELFSVEENEPQPES